MNYYNIPEHLQYKPHNVATPEGWAEYERKISATMSERIISSLPAPLVPVELSPGMLERFQVPGQLRRIPFHKETFDDPITGHPLSQISFENGWGDDEKFHASVNYNYINPWNPKPVRDESWIAVVAMNVEHPEYGNRVYVIRQDGSEARCLAVNCEFAYALHNAKPYLHVAPIFWLDKETVFFSQSNGISLKVNINTWKIDFIPGLSRHCACFPSPDGKRIAYAPLASIEAAPSNSIGFIDLCGQCFTYEFASGEQKKLCDLYDIMKLHPELDPAGFQLTWYLGNFQWSYDSKVLNFFTMLFHNGRVIRDLCAINYDGSGLHIVIASDDTQRYPVDGRKRKFGHLFPSGSILQNHQAILPGDKQIICCTQEPFSLPPGKEPNPIDCFIDTRFLILADMDDSRLQLIQGDDLNFDGHPSSNPQGTFWLGSDYNNFIKIMDPNTCHVSNLFSLEKTNCNHPHETWSSDGRHILFRRSGRSGQLFTADISYIYK